MYFDLNHRYNKRTYKSFGLFPRTSEQLYIVSKTLEVKLNLYNFRIRLYINNPNLCSFSDIQFTKGGRFVLSFTNICC